MSQGCHRGSAGVSQGLKNGVTGMSQGCRKGVTGVSQRVSHGLSQGCRGDVTGVSQECHRGVAYYDPTLDALVQTIFFAATTSACIPSHITNRI